MLADLADEVVELFGHLPVGRGAVTKRYRPEIVAPIATLQEERRVILPVAGVPLRAVNEHDRCRVAVVPERSGRAADTVEGLSTPPAVSAAGRPRQPRVCRSVVLAVDRTAAVAPVASKPAQDPKQRRRERPSLRRTSGKHRLYRPSDGPMPLLRLFVPSLVVPPFVSYTSART